IAPLRSSPRRAGEGEAANGAFTIMMTRSLDEDRPRERERGQPSLYELARGLAVAPGAAREPARDLRERGRRGAHGRTRLSDHGAGRDESAAARDGGVAG